MDSNSDGAEEVEAVTATPFDSDRDSGESAIAKMRQAAVEQAGHSFTKPEHFIACMFKVIQQAR